ncbi:helix-hairpin-helix domain-containing protein [Oceanobacillus caeni]|uniref:helix-hairpin-helix domain-containing protein n=1 Tax=Oceanobacillus caeni TaxID=405946 RepID=UPI001C24700A|nr:helix-hairpin-helix domain-containing protein [Oceanobacillus caeni]MBU8789487.1 helix-hairpin-helix domain-containing protein [Oceanobacillus caeni]
MLDLLKKSSFFILISIVIIFIFFFSKDESIPKDEELISSASTLNSEIPVKEVLNDSASQQDTIFVDVKGAVEQPGVYEMTTENRVKDVIEKAGGLTKDADQSQVNLAQKVHDEMIIMVPELPDLNVDSGQTADTVSSNIDGKVRINYATQDEIETLPGIGPSKAQAIIQHREEFGLFQTVEDLLEISGIGEKTLENMKDNIQIP